MIKENLLKKEKITCMNFHQTPQLYATLFLKPHMEGKCLKTSQLRVSDLSRTSQTITPMYRSKLIKYSSRDKDKTKNSHHSKLDAFTVLIATALVKQLP